MKKKMADGPAGMLIYFDRWEGSMGKNSIQWFVYLVVVSLFVAYLTGRLLPAGTAYLSVFRVAGTVGGPRLCGRHRPAQHLVGSGLVDDLKAVFDGVVYGLLTAGAFGWLWPR